MDEKEGGREGCPCRLGEGEGREGAPNATKLIPVDRHNLNTNTTAQT